MFQVRTHKFFKHYVFLLTVHEGNAFWSAHPYEGSKQATTQAIAAHLQTEHDIQVLYLMKQAAENEPAEFKEVTVEDQTVVLPSFLKKAKDK